MREAVERDLVRIDLGLHILEVQERHGLLGQFVHGLFARAGNGLEGGDDDPLDPGGIMDGLERHNQGDGGAVRVGDDAAVLCDRLGIHFGHDQRDLGVHAEGAGVIDDHCA